jgi:hypothetical protein
LIRTFALFVLVLWMMALGTIASCTGARADQLHPVYLGKWCHQSGNAKSKNKTYYRDGGRCFKEDMLIIEPTGYHGWEFDCRYISIKNTGQRLPASTKPRKADWIPVVRIFAHCEAEGEEPANPEFILKYYKGTLTIAEAN